MASARYVADPEVEIESIALDGLVLLYHRPSGMTHIVAPPAPQILEALRLGPAEPGEILARMRAWYALEGEAEARAVEARLEELEQAGLVSKEALAPPTFTERAEIRPHDNLPDVPAGVPVAGRGRRFRDLVDRRAAAG